MIVIQLCLSSLEHRSLASLKKIDMSVCRSGLFSLANLAPCCCPFGACLCNSAVHATNPDASQDLTVQNAAMFLCSHVFFGF